MKPSVKRLSIIAPIIILLSVFLLYTFEHDKIGDIRIDKGSKKVLIKKEIESTNNLMKSIITYLFSLWSKIKTDGNLIKFSGKFEIFINNGSEILQGIDDDVIEAICHDLKLNKYYKVHIGKDYSFSEYIPRGTYLLIIRSRSYGTGGIIMNLRDSLPKELSIRLFADDENLEEGFLGNCEDNVVDYELVREGEVDCGFREEDFSCSIEGVIEEMRGKNITIVALPDLRICKNGSDIFSIESTPLWGDTLDINGRFLLENVWCGGVRVYVYDRINLNYCRARFIKFEKRNELVSFSLE